jgi:hypothetical protein
MITLPRFLLRTTLRPVQKCTGRFFMSAIRRLSATVHPTRGMVFIMTSLKYFILPALAIGLATVSATAADQAVIPAAGHKGIVGWQANGAEGMWLKSVDGRWFYAQTEGECRALLTATQISFRTSAVGELDRFGALLAGGVACPLSSLVHSEAPNRS